MKNSTESPAVILRRFKNKEGRLQSVWASTDKQWAPTIDDNLQTALTYLQCVESLVSEFYMLFVERTPSMRNPYIMEFVAMWEEEETFHGQVLAEVLAAGNVTPLAPKQELSALSAYALNIIPPTTFWAFHMTIGMLNERITQFAYSELAKMTEDETLTRILTAIAQEESKHLAFYKGMSRHYMQELPSVSKKLIGWYINHLWGGIGSGEIGEEASLNLKKVLIFKHRERLSSMLDKDLSFVGLQINPQKTPLFRQRVEA